MDLLLLIFLGAGGWFLFSLIRLPVPALLGSLAMIGLLRILEYPLPTSPEFLSPIVQVMLGFYVGSKIDKETVYRLKKIIKPAFVIIVWTLSVAFLLGLLFSKFTGLDIHTSILSLGLGGLPEKIIIGLAAAAKLEIIIAMHVFRLLATIIIYPLLFKIITPHYSSFKGESESDKAGEQNGFVEKLQQIKRSTAGCLASINKKALLADFLLTWGLSLIIAFAGGAVFLKLGVPAGGMVGALIFTAVFSLKGLKIAAFPAKYFNPLLLGVGILVADTISTQTLATITDLYLMIFILLFTLLIFLSSFLVAFILNKMTAWGFTYCLMAAAPGGIFAMIGLSALYNEDPFELSILHFCRVITVKITFPFAFMFIGG